MKNKVRVPILISIALALLSACAPARPHLEEGVVVTIPPSGLPAMQLNDTRSAMVGCTVPGGQSALLARATYFAVEDPLYEVAVKEKGNSCNGVKNILVKRRDLKKFQTQGKNEAEQFIKTLCEAAILDSQTIYQRFCGKEGN